VTFADAAVGYVPTDDFFGAPYVDEDVARNDPAPHRAVHGGFAGTDTRFTLYFPVPDAYRRRLVHFLEGGTGGNERTMGAGIHAAALPLGFRHGAVVAESNQGHVGTSLCAKAGADPTIYGYRANAEVTRLATDLARAHYGEAPAFRYLAGGSGGGKRTLVGLEQVPGLWDGGLAWIIANGGPFPTTVLHATACNARRLLGDRLDSVIDATEAGGSGDPFGGLDLAQREVLAELYHSGFPRGSEHMLLGSMHLVMFCWEASNMAVQDHDYFDAFWTRPGYVGHDRPELVSDDIVDVKATIVELVEVPTPLGPSVGVRLAGAESAPSLPGTRIELLDGRAAGRRLVCNGVVDGVVTAVGSGEDGVLRFDGVEPGDEVHLDNRDFLAWCYYPHHHVVPWLEHEFADLMVDGRPVHPQHPAYALTPIMGPDCTGAFSGKLVVVHNAHDSIVYPGNAVEYVRRAREAHGGDLDESFRLWWNEHAEHGGPEMAPPWRGPSTTRLLDYQGSLGRALDELVAWVEDGAPPPPSTAYDYDGALTFPRAAASRRGIQPVVRATADGAVRAETAAAVPVALRVEAEAPPGAGRLVRAAWDLDGSGAFATRINVPTGVAALDATIEHAFTEPGAHFVAVRVESHADGRVDDPLATVANLARVRVVVATA
jgi:hypothetical protein